VIAAAAPTPAAAATASFTAPVDLASAQFGLGAAAATDATGATTVLITGSGAPKLLERQPGAGWPAATRLPGDPRGVKGPVVSAAGQGALGIAWRVDKPRRYSGIQAEVRDPGGALSMPIDVAGTDAGGVRHPALAVDQAGDALLAYNTDTRKNHLSLRGAIAVTYRPAHGSFSTPVVVDDQPSQPPVVALAPDGTGIVAWTRNGHAHAVSITRRELGKVKAVAAVKGVDNLAVAASPGGEPTIAWSGSRNSSRLYELHALRRFAGRAFGPVRVVARTRAYISSLALAADETGNTTAAWSEDDYGNKTGYNGIVTAVRTATAATGHGFGTARSVAAGTTRYRQALSLAAVNGRVALAWGYKSDSRHIGVQAAIGRPGAIRPPQTIASSTVVGDFLTDVPTARITLDATGAATVVAIVASEPAPQKLSTRLIAVDGR
jgi:hypothetical protein